MVEILVWACSDFRCMRHVNPRSTTGICELPAGPPKPAVVLPICYLGILEDWVRRRNPLFYLVGAEGFEPPTR